VDARADVRARGTMSGGCRSSSTPLDERSTHFAKWRSRRTACNIDQKLTERSERWMKWDGGEREGSIQYLLGRPRRHCIGICLCDPPYVYIIMQQVRLRHRARLSHHNRGGKKS